MSQVEPFYFGGGPAALPKPVLQQMSVDSVSFADTGLSIMELSHRSAAYESIQQEAETRLRRLLGISDDYEILFLQGGASLQFAMVPMNFLDGRTGAYVMTGTWSKKAYEEAGRIGQVRIAASSEQDGFRYIPEHHLIQTEPTDAYVHITTNNTIVGSEWHTYPTVPAPLVADMSSDILSRPFSVDQFHLIYAGAQKNLGPAGVTLVIVRKDWIKEHESSISTVPTILRYSTHAKNASKYNTPPVYAVRAIGLVLQWVEEHGGLEAMDRFNEQKSSLLYSTIDESNGFYTGVVNAGSRSRMNVTFRLPSEELEKEFLTAAKQAGFQGLAGHRSVGGIRVSLYNAVPMNAVEHLVAFLNQFKSKH